MNSFRGSGASTSHMVFRCEPPRLTLVSGSFATSDKGIVADIVERPSQRRAIGLTLENGLFCASVFLLSHGCSASVYNSVARGGLAVSCFYCCPLNSLLGEVLLLIHTGALAGDRNDLTEGMNRFNGFFCGVHKYGEVNFSYGEFSGKVSSPQSHP
jgi:hypothetical protein